MTTTQGQYLAAPVAIGNTREANLLLTDTLDLCVDMGVFSGPPIQNGYVANTSTATLIAQPSGDVVFILIQNQSDTGLGIRFADLGQSPAAFAYDNNCYHISARGESRFSRTDLVPNTPIWACSESGNVNVHVMEGY